MKDKYEEFKSWILESDIGFHKIARIKCEKSHIRNIDHISAEFICFDCKDLFEQFEEKYLEQIQEEMSEKTLGMRFEQALSRSPVELEFNIYHRTSKQLKEHLRKHDFPVEYVSRSEVGNKSYYNVEFNVKEDEWDFEKTNSNAICSLLDIENVGLVDFFRKDDIIHEVILIDEDELNGKYLKNGNLRF